MDAKITALEANLSKLREPTPEELARINIDEQLEAACWVVQDFKALNLGMGQGVAISNIS